MTTMIYIVSNINKNTIDLKANILVNMKKCVHANSLILLMPNMNDLNHCCRDKFTKKMEEYIDSYNQLCRDVKILENHYTFLHNSKIFVCLGNYPSHSSLKYFEKIISLSMNLPFILFFNYGMDDVRWTMTEKNRFIEFIDQKRLNIICLIFNTTNNTTIIKTLETTNKKIPIISSGSNNSFIEMKILFDGNINAINEIFID